jgi:hypothetical protein
MAPHITSVARKVKREGKAADLSLHLPLPGLPLENMEFELRGEVFYVQSVMAGQVCDVLPLNPGSLRCAVEVTNENADDLWGVCNEFQFWSRRWKL